MMCDQKSRKLQPPRTVVDNLSPRCELYTQRVRSNKSNPSAMSQIFGGDVPKDFTVAHFFPQARLLNITIVLLAGWYSESQARW